MSNYGKKIEIFLMDGTTDGLKQVNIRNWTGVCFSAYRNNIKDFLSLKELENNIGIYFLIGINDENERCMYIGETEDIALRIKQHTSKEFWTQCITFVSKLGEINKAHIKYLEGCIYEDLKSAEQVILMNEHAPKKSVLSLADMSVMEEFKDNVYLILGVLGFLGITEKKILKKSEEKTSLENYTFSLEKKNIVYGYMTPTFNGYKVLKGAKLHPDIAKYLYHNSVKKSLQKRENLRQKGIITRNNNNEEILLKDQIFNSPSGSAVFLLGRPINGRTDWKTEDGKTFKEIEEIILEIENKNDKKN